MLETQGKDSGEQFTVVDELKSIVRRRRQRQKDERVQKLKELNDERIHMREKSTELQGKRREHKMLLSKGMDFVVAVERGDAPPLKYIMKNMQRLAGEEEDEEEEEDDEDEDEDLVTVEAMVDNLEKQASEQKATIEQLREVHTKTLGAKK